MLGSLAIASHVQVPPLQLDLFWIAMRASNVLSYAGPLSVDRALSPGSKKCTIATYQPALSGPANYSQYAFAYRHMGSLATIGRKSAIADLRFIRLRGALAWWLCGLNHFLFLLGLRNRVAVTVAWLWSYFIYRPATRFITGSSDGN